MDSFKIEVESSDTKKELCVILYSCSQGCLHVERITECIEGNLAFLGIGKSPDYILVGIADNMDQALDYSNQLDAIRHQWPGYEVFTGGDKRPLLEILKNEESQ